MVAEYRSGDPLPYGVFTTVGRDDASVGASVGVAVGDQVLDLTAISAARRSPYASLFETGSLDPLLRSGRRVWDRVRAQVRDWLAEHQRGEPTLGAYLLARGDVRMHLPFTVADYVDFYASEQHASTVGALFRPDGDPLPAAWRHLPMGYHGRAGSVIASGSNVPRPSGLLGQESGQVIFGRSTQLDFEAEVGFVVGTGSTRGTTVSLDDIREHVFGVVLVNDWSARDIQSFEARPLGPMLGKSFATSISAWVLPLDELDAAHVSPPIRDPRPAAYLDDGKTEPWGLQLSLAVTINGTLVATPQYSTMYWTPAQMLAHLTVGGAALRSGDLLASGTVSSPGDSGAGSLLERTTPGTPALTLDDGSSRTFLHDGDEVVITGSAPGANGSRVVLGEVRGRITG